MAKSIPYKPQVEYGASGVSIQNGIITGEEYNPKLRGREALRVWDEMRRSDATVRAALTAVKLLIKAAEWHVQPATDDEADKAIAEHVDYNLFTVLNWQQVLDDILTHLDFGFSVHEEVYGPALVGGRLRVVLTKFAYRKQTSIYSWQMSDGQPGVHQITLDGGKYDIPRNKLAIFSHQKEGDNPEGISILRAAYQHWYYKRTLYQIDAIGHERQALGVVKIKYPTTAANKDGKERESARQAARQLRANEEAFIEEPQGWDINFMDMKASTLKDVKPSIDHHDRQISKNVLAQFLEIGASGGSGTRSTSEDHSRLFELACQAVAQNIADAFNEQVVKTLVDLNYNVSEYPKLAVGKVGDDNMAEVADSVSKLVTAGFLNPTEEDEAHIRKLLRLPEMSEDGDPAATEDEDAEEGIEELGDEKLQAAARKVHASVTRLLYDGQKQAA